MTDQEVGKLWNRGHFNGLPHTHPGSAVGDLIRKLVEERAVKLLLQRGICIWRDEELFAAIRVALGEFGIDPETWF
jgi:hypothetical protein